MRPVNASLETSRSWCIQHPVAGWPRTEEYEKKEPCQHPITHMSNIGIYVKIEEYEKKEP